MHYRWDRLAARRCVLPEEDGGHEAVAWRCAVGWRVWVPALGLDVVVRNRAYQTWITAGPVVDRVLGLELGAEAEALHSSPEAVSAWATRRPDHQTEADGE